MNKTIDFPLLDLDIGVSLFLATAAVYNDFAAALYFISFALLTYPIKLGATNVIRIAIIAITTTNSIRVKPLFLVCSCFFCNKF